MAGRTDGQDMTTEDHTLPSNLLEGTTIKCQQVYSGLPKEVVFLRGYTFDSLAAVCSSLKLTSSRHLTKEEMY